MKPGDLIRWNRRFDALSGAKWLDHVAVVLRIGEEPYNPWISISWLNPLIRGQAVVKRSDFEVLSEAK